MRLRIYDATLTEGTRGAGIQFSARDKLRIAVRLGEMGVSWVEAGWPADHPEDAELLRTARGMSPDVVRLAACVEIRLGGRAAGDRALGAALRTGAPAVTLFATVWRRRSGRAGSRVPKALASAVRRVRAAGREAIADLGDFFDAYREHPTVALAAVEAAAREGAEAILLSDTLGGTLPGDVEAGVAAVRRVARGTAIGIRARDDAGLALACSLAAVGKGATVVAGTVNGFGERCGVTDLVSLLPALELKLGRHAIREGQLRHITGLAHFVAELADQQLSRRRPYAGRDAFPEEEQEERPALHHVDPAAVGNRAEPAMSDARGYPRALRAARELGLVPAGGAGARRMVDKLAEWERRGFRYEGAEASFELLLRSLAGRRRPYFRLLGYRTLDVHRPDGKGFTEATVEVQVGGETIHAAAQGVGPVHALDQALRRALEGHYPELKDMRVIDARSRSLPGVAGSAAAARVLVESGDGRDVWGTAGVSENLLEAICQALCDAIEHKLVKDEVTPRMRKRKG